MIEQLLHEPWRFDFFQAVRLLNFNAVVQAKKRAAAEGCDPEDLRYLFVGEDKPGREAVHFGAMPSLTFPTAQVAALAPAENAESNGQTPLEMTVTFMGLTGPQGVLPTHYTSLLIERLSKKDRTMLEFFDLFNHRLVSLFYRAWEKYRVAPSFERARLLGEVDDPLTSALTALVGMAPPSLQNRLGVDDATIRYFSGHFSRQVRSAQGLEQLLNDVLGVSVSIVQFIGRWLPLDVSAQSQFPESEEMNDFCNMQLGETIVLGERVWDVQGAFRVRLGPLNFEQYQALLPGGKRVAELCSLTRMFAGPEFQFDYMPVLRADCIPALELGQTATLGQTGWLRSVEPKAPHRSPYPETDFDGAVFDSSGN